MPTRVRASPIARRAAASSGSCGGIGSPTSKPCSSSPALMQAASECFWKSGNTPRKSLKGMPYLTRDGQVQ
ncbi:MAG: hypothetical protein A3F92_05560 [Candidatus Rokubacteria bacterium RIFCSPLOWO2_12_FULL_71_22]|nr:MAG: hypothetical protein A3F92_05560 [Candidatus Rokubacteria bacterium RIFCSPLOWO2_12_FULL_71_22]